MSFQPFEPRDDIEFLNGNLPHWRQEGKTYFVTFRTADSLPQHLVRTLEEEIAKWAAVHPEP